MTTNERIENFVKTIRKMSDEQLNTVADGVISLLEAIDRPEEPQYKDRCVFWNGNINVYTVDELCLVDRRGEKPIYITPSGIGFKNCKRLTREAE